MTATDDAQPPADPAAAALQVKFTQGLTLHQQGKLADAECIYEEVLRLQPRHFDALHLLGVVAAQTQRTDRAAELIGRAIELNAGVAAAHNNLGNTLRMLKRFEEALASLDRAISLRPDFAEAHSNRGLALNDLKRFEEALPSFDRAIALRPDLADAYNDRAVALTKLNRPEQALANLDQAIALRPTDATTYSNRGIALFDLRRCEEALASYDRAIALSDADQTVQAPISGEAAQKIGEVCLNQSFCLLSMGRFEQGWRQYERRPKRPEVFAAVAGRAPLWLGEEDISGKTLFVHWEQGLGDTIQFCRYAALAEARGARVIMSVQKPLQTLLRQISPTVQIIGPNEVPADFDYHCPLMSLPLAFRTTLATILAVRRYLQADEKSRVKWSLRLPRKTRPRIGMAWSGHENNRNDHKRSMELQKYLPLLGPDADWICLQNEVREKDFAVLRQIGRITYFGDALRDFADTAALLDMMDLVITADTCIAHLAGAMGKPVWILLPYSPDWRWLQTGDNSPWYPSARLFRQTQIGNWAAVMDQVQTELRSVIN
jgi:tetratricopeptide (TPR) repeat protein